MKTNHGVQSAINEGTSSLRSTAKCGINLGANQDVFEMFASYCLARITSQSMASKSCSWFCTRLISQHAMPKQATSLETRGTLSTILAKSAPC